MKFNRMIEIRLIIRSIIRNKSSFIINVIGLSVSFAISLIILSYLTREFSYDRSITNLKRISRVITTREVRGWKEPNISYPMHNKIINDIPGIEAAAIIRDFSSLSITLHENNINVESGYGTTNDYFKVFTPKVILGNQEQFLSDPYSTVLTRSFAEKVYGKIPGIGTELEVNLRGEQLILHVSGIIEDFPETTTIRPEMLLSFTLMRYEFKEGTLMGDFWDRWDQNLFEEYILIEKTSYQKDIANRISLLEKSLPENIDCLFSLQPLCKVHLYSSGLVNTIKGGDIKLARLSILIGLLVLLLATTNFIILSIATIPRKTYQAAIQKIYGSIPFRIVMNIISESLIICIFSVLVAFLLMKVSAGKIEELFGISLGIISNKVFVYIVLVGLLVLCISIISGFYISRRVNNISPKDAIAIRTNSKKGNTFYKILIITQITIFVSLLSSSLLVNNQIRYSLKSDPGYNSKDLIKKAIVAQRKQISGIKGNKKVNLKKFEEAQEPQHFAISLSGEPLIDNKFIIYNSELRHAYLKNKSTKPVFCLGWNFQII